ncbi:MAG: AI-2E family transporter, partial [Myxococcales bacterium]|nr:AI-2E family transporter [Myxococcales bacterium]
IDLWLLIGLIAGFGNLVPYFGTAVGLALGVGAALFQFGDLLHVAAVAGVFAAVQFIEGFVLTPRIIGEKVGLHPMVVMVAILAGGELFGFVGILLAVPATAVGGVFFRHSLRTYKASALFNPKASDEASGDDAPPGPPGAPGS